MVNIYSNKEKVKIYNRKYRKENREYISQQKKNAYALHAHNRIKNAVLVTCNCGAKLTAGSLYRHKKSPYHHRMLESFELFFCLIFS